MLSTSFPCLFFFRRFFDWIFSLSFPVFAQDTIAKMSQSLSVFFFFLSLYLQLSVITISEEVLEKAKKTTVNLSLQIPFYITKSSFKSPRFHLISR